MYSARRNPHSEQSNGMCALPDILQVLERKLTGLDLMFSGDQREVLVRALTMYKDPKFDLTRPFRVSFNNQPAPDVGGPRREFFSILYEDLIEMDGNPLPALFEGEPRCLLPVYDPRSFYSYAFVCVGKMIAHSIVQCGVGFPYLAPCVYWYLVTNDISNAVGYARIEDVRDSDLAAALRKPDNRQLCMESLYLTMLNKKKSVLDQIIDGLKSLDVLDEIRQRPMIFEPLFVSRSDEELTPERVKSILCFGDEALSKEHLLRFIGDSSSNDLKKFTRYCSGGNVLPRKLKVVFDGGDVIFAFTCSLELHLPAAMSCYEIFEAAIKAVLNDNGHAFNAM